MEALATVHREEPAVEYADPPALSANEHGVMVAITDQLVEMKEGIKSEALSFLVDHSVFPDDFTVSQAPIMVGYFIPLNLKICIYYILERWNI